ncbi:hypothetical protein BG000_011797 [Podila horticola]|nr:hypothetical protein BG000_011797 [Podila horticola]
MNLSAILNDPGTSLPTNHSRTKSGAVSPSQEMHHFDSNHPSLEDYYDNRSNGNQTNNNSYHPDANNTNNTNYTKGSESRKHASSVSVNQLEQLSALSNGHDNSLTGPNLDHPMHSHDYHPSESGKGKIRPNESNNTYSTSTFRAAPRASFANNAKTTSPPSSSLSSPVASSSSSPATFHTMSPSSLAPTAITTSQTATLSATATGTKESSTNSPIAKKKPRQQQEIVFSSSDLSHDPDGRSTKKKPGRKTSAPISGHDDPFEIRFVMTDKDGLDKSKNAKSSVSSSSATTPANTSTPQDSQDEDTGDQDTSESSPQPDFERNAEGK